MILFTTFADAFIFQLLRLFALIVSLVKIFATKTCFLIYRNCWIFSYIFPLLSTNVLYIGARLSGRRLIFNYDTVKDSYAST